MADQDSKLDKVLTHLDSIHKRLDAIEEEHKKDRADAAEMKARADAAEKERKDKERRDAEETPEQRSEREAADEKRRADTAERVRAEHARADATQAERLEFVEAQVRADAAYQAWSLGQAPHALHGESLRDFQIRLLTPLKKHSRTYKDSALGLIGDDATFSVVEGAIINDAIEASNTTVVAGAPLREVKTRMDSGHIVTKFVGDPAVTWAPFMGGATQFGRINTNAGKR